MPTPEQREYYARRAIEVRKLATATTDPDIRETLEFMGKSYDTLVEEIDLIGVMRGRLPKG